MPVVFDSSRFKRVTISSATTSASATVSANVNPSASNVVALVWVLLVSSVDLSAATFAATFDGNALTSYGDPATWNLGKSKLQAFRFDDPDGGVNDVVGSCSSIPTGGIERQLLVAVATYAGVDYDAIGTPVIAGNVDATANSVTVPSVLPAHRVVAVHATSSAGLTWHDYTQTKRIDSYAPRNTVRLILGDAPGDDSVVSSVTQQTAANWGAWGVTMGPAIVDGGASLTIPAPMTVASGGIYRTAFPAPDRYWLIPAVDSPDNDPNNLSLLRGADGVVMPVWFKDPQDIQDYTLDFSRLLVEDDYIIDATFSPSASSLSVLSSNIADSVQTSRTDAAVSVWLSGGVASVNYGVTCHITTQEGRQHDRTFRIVGGQN